MDVKSGIVGRVAENMWLFTSNGFLSIVADKNNPKTGRLLVRSRDKLHISNIFPNAEVFSVPNSDYQWRAWVSRTELTNAVTSYVEKLDYTNFKNSIPMQDHIYYQACMDVWGAVHYNYTKNQ